MGPEGCQNEAEGIRGPGWFHGVEPLTHSESPAHLQKVMWKRNLHLFEGTEEETSEHTPKNTKSLQREHGPSNTLNRRPRWKSIGTGARFSPGAGRSTGSRVADRVLVLWLGVRPEPLRWESRVQDIGPPETSQPHIISIDESSPRDRHLNANTQLHSTTSKLQCWTPHAKQLVRQEHKPTH